MRAGYTHGVTTPNNVDAFGRLRVSQPHTLFDSKFVFDAQPLLWDDAQTSGGGTSSTHSANRASVSMAVSNLTAGTRVRQTFRRIRYEPGKSQLVGMTFVMGPAATGITKRIGPYDAQNGIFLQQTSTGLAIVRRSFVTGVAVDEVVPQASWTQDRLDGTGNSGMTMDVTKAQLMQIDYQWFGAGTIRVGFFSGDIFVPAHQFVNANVLTSVWATTGNFPLRYEISNAGTGPVASIEHICGGVISEGGTESAGIIYSLNSGATTIIAAALGTEYALRGVRLKSTAKTSTINLLRFSISVSDVNALWRWQVKLNPTVAGTFTYASVTDSSLETAVGVAANTVTGGILLDSGYAYSRSEVTIDPTSLIRLGFSIADVADTLVLTTTPVLVTNQNTYSAITWQELL